MIKFLIINITKITVLMISIKTFFFFFFVKGSSMRGMSSSSGQMKNSMVNIFLKYLIKMFTTTMSLGCVEYTFFTKLIII